MAAVIRRIQHFIFSYDWEIVEIQGAFFKLTWAVWLLLPFQTFRSISGYASVGTENIWGIGLLILGACHLAAIKSHHIPVRRAMTFIAFLFWLFTVLLIWTQSSTAALLPFFGVFAFFMGINFLRLGRQQQSIDQRVQDIGPPPGVPERRNRV